MHVSLRDLAPLDLDRMVELERRTSLPGGGRSSWTREKLQGELAHEDVTGRGVLEDELVVGFACWRRMVDELWLMEVVVAADHRRRGHGRRLVEDGVSLAVRDELTSVWLEVRSGNGPARALYRAAGFTVVTTRRRYYGDGEDAVLMKREL